MYLDLDCFATKIVYMVEVLKMIFKSIFYFYGILWDPPIGLCNNRRILTGGGGFGGGAISHGGGGAYGGGHQGKMHISILNFKIISKFNSFQEVEVLEAVV